jgi:hypothetical protein
VSDKRTDNANVRESFRTSELAAREEERRKTIEQRATAQLEQLRLRQARSQAAQLPQDPRDRGLVQSLTPIALRAELTPRIQRTVGQLQRNLLAQEDAQAELDAPFGNTTTARRRSRRLFETRTGLEEQIVRLATQGATNLKDKRFDAVIEPIARFRAAGNGLGDLRRLQQQLGDSDHIAGNSDLSDDTRREARNTRRRAEIELAAQFGISSDAQLNAEVQRRTATRGNAAATIAGTLQQIVAADKELDQQSKRGGLQGFATRIQTLTQYLGASTLIFGAIAGLRSVLREVTTLEAELVRVQGILGVTADSVRNNIADGVIGAARDFGVSVRESLEAFKVFAQAGFNQKEALSRTRASLLGVQGLGLQSQQSQELLLAVGNVSNDRVQPGAILDRISEVERTNAVTAQDLSLAIQRVGSITTQLQPKSIGGVDAFDLVSGLTTQIVEQTRVSGNQAATSLRFILARLGAPDVANKLQNNFGIKLGGNTPNELRPLVDILSDIGRTYQTLKSTGNTVKANELLSTFAGARQLNAAAALFDNFNKVMDVATQSSRAFGDAQRRLTLQQGTVEYQLKSLGVEFSGFLQQFTRNSGVLRGARGVLGGTENAVGGLGAAFSAAPLSSTVAGIGAVVGTQTVLARIGTALAATRFAATGTGITALASGPILTGLLAVLGVFGVLSLLGKALESSDAKALNNPANILKNAQAAVKQVPQFTEFNTLAQSVGTSREGLIAAGNKAFAAGNAALVEQFGTSDIGEIRKQGKEITSRVFDVFDKASTAALDELLKAVEQNPTERKELARSLLKQIGVQQEAVSVTLTQTLQGKVDGLFGDFEADLAKQDFGELSNRTSGLGSSKAFPSRGKESLSTTLGDRFGAFGAFLQGVLTRAPGVKRAVDNSDRSLAGGLDALVRSAIDPEFTGTRASLLSTVNTAGAAGGALPSSARFNSQAQAAVADLAKRSGAEPEALRDVAAFVQRRKEFEAAITAQLDEQLKTSAFGSALRTASGGTGGLTVAQSPEAALRQTVDRIIASVQATASARVAELRAQGRNKEAAAQEATLQQLQNPDTRRSVTAAIGGTDIGLRGLVKDRLTDIVASFAAAAKEVSAFGEAMRRTGGTFDDASELNNIARSSLRALIGVEGDVLKNLLQVESKAQQAGELGRAGPLAALSQIDEASGDGTTPERTNALVLDGLKLSQSKEVVAQREALNRQGEQLVKQLEILRGSQAVGALSPRSRRTLDQVFAQPIGDGVNLDARRLFAATQVKQIQAIFEEVFAATEKILVGRQARQTAIRELGDLGLATQKFASDVTALRRSARIQLVEALRGPNAARELRLDDIGQSEQARQGLIATDFATRRSVLEADLRARGVNGGAADLERAKLALDQAKAQQAAANEAQLRLETFTLEDKKAAAIARDARGGAVLQPVERTLTDVLADPFTLNTGSKRGGAVRAFADALGNAFQQAMASAFVNNVFGPDGLLGKQLRESIGDSPLLKGADALRTNLELGGKTVADQINLAMTAGADLFKQAVARLEALQLQGGQAAASLLPFPSTGVGTTNIRTGFGIADTTGPLRKSFTLPASSVLAGAGVLAAESIQPLLPIVTTADFVPPQLPPAQPNVGTPPVSTAGQTRGQQVRNAALQLAALLATQAGAAIGNRGRPPGNASGTGASIGSAVGGIAGGYFGPVGSIVGSGAGGFLGGLVGGQFGGKNPELPNDPLQRIERNTRETVTAIENQSRLLELQDRLINVPATFTVPRYRPSDVGGWNGGGAAGNTTSVGSIQITVSGANDPAAVADAVYQRLSHEMQVQVHTAGLRG